MSVHLECDSHKKSYVSVRLVLTLKDHFWAGHGARGDGGCVSIQADPEDGHDHYEKRDKDTVDDLCRGLVMAPLDLLQLGRSLSYAIPRTGFVSRQGEPTSPIEVRSFEHVLQTFPQERHAHAHG